VVWQAVLVFRNPCGVQFAYPRPILGALGAPDRRNSRMSDEQPKVIAAKTPDNVREAAVSTRRMLPSPGGDAKPDSKPKSRQERERDAKLDLLRELRAEVQGLQSLLVNVRDGQVTLRTYAGYIERSRREISALFDRIHAVLPDGEVAHGDNIRHIHNQWQMLMCSPIITNPGGELEADIQVKELASCDRLCHEMVSEIGQLTIPASLNRWLLNGWNGYLLSFHDLFSNELPRFEDRQRHLRILASVPGLIRGGIVEPVTGCIFPYHDTWYKRLGICLSIALGYVAVTVGIWNLDLKGWLGVTTAETMPDSALGIRWLLVVLGVLTHFAVSRAKNSSSGAVAVVPLGHPTYVIDARAGIVLLKGMLMLVGFFALLLLDTREMPGHLDFFLVGYSLDSFTGIISASLDQRAATRGAEMAQRLGP
jgi:hypothetical protein